MQSKDLHQSMQPTPVINAAPTDTKLLPDG